jgi:16S rRNA (adenine1518-N6/adenine1519-N6)-dimethyltransferase
MSPPLRKRFGQHFLAPGWARKVVDAIAPGPADVFLEIGPGTGALTRPLAARSKEVLAIEIDRDLAARLAGQVPGNVRVVTGNFLDVDAESLVRESAPADGLRVAGNLPYNISSPILFRLLELHRRTALVRDATVMLQREVVDRITARPGSRDYGVLTIMLRLYADAESLLLLPPGAFRPAPKVWSAVARLRFVPPTASIARPELFERIVKTAFSQRRKTLANALKPLLPEPGAAAVVLERAGIDPRRRPETLDLPELAALAALLGS